MSNQNIDVEEYIRNIIRDERKPNPVNIQTASKNRANKEPMHGFDVAVEPGYYVQGPLGPAGE